MTSGRIPVAGLVGLVLATLFWAGNYVFGAIAVTTVDPFSLTFLRWALALVPLVIVAQAVERPDWRTLLRHWPFLALRGALGLAAYSLLLYFALGQTSALTASLINAANPAMIAISARLFLGDKLRPTAAIGVAVALLGVLAIITDGSITAVFGTSFGAGDLLMLGAITAWTAYTLAARFGPELPPISATAGEAGLAVVAMALFAPFLGIALPQTPAAGWSLLFIVVFPSCASYILWNRAVLSVSPVIVGASLNLITVFAALATTIQGIPISASQAVGGLVVLAGVVLTSLPLRGQAGDSKAEVSSTRARPSLRRDAHGDVGRWRGAGSRE